MMMMFHLFIDTRAKETSLHTRDEIFQQKCRWSSIKVEIINLNSSTHSEDQINFNFQVARSDSKAIDLSDIPACRQKQSDLNFKRLQNNNENEFQKKIKKFNFIEEVFFSSGS